MFRVHSIHAFSACATRLSHKPHRLDRPDHPHRLEQPTCECSHRPRLCWTCPQWCSWPWLGLYGPPERWTHKTWLLSQTSSQSPWQAQPAVNKQDVLLCTRRKQSCKLLPTSRCRNISRIYHLRQDSYVMAILYA